MGYKFITKAEFEKIKALSGHLSASKSAEIFNRSYNTVQRIYGSKDWADYQDRRAERSNRVNAKRQAAKAQSFMAEARGEEMPAPMEIELSPAEVDHKIPEMTQLTAFYKGIYALGTDNQVYEWTKEGWTLKR